MVYTVEPGFRNQSRPLWFRFLNPGSALNPGKSISQKAVRLPVLSALNQGSALNPRFLNPGSTVVFFIACIDFWPLVLIYDLPYPIYTNRTYQQMEKKVIALTVDSDKVGKMWEPCEKADNKTVIKAGSSIRYLVIHNPVFSLLLTPTIRAS